MRSLRYIPILLLMHICSKSNAQQQTIILEKPYSFIIADGEISRLQQRNDTLQWLHGRLYDVSQTKNLIALEWEVSKQYKIRTSQHKDSLWYLALERLDSILLSTDPLPEDRFSVIALHQGNGQQIGIVQLAIGLNEQALDSTVSSFIDHKELFFTTYFCDAQWRVFGSLRTIETKDDALQIREKLQSDEVKDWLRLYESNPVKDIYGTGLTTELLNRVSIAMGYNPIGASKILQHLHQE